MLKMNIIAMWKLVTDILEYMLSFLDVLPFARYEREQDKQGLYHHFQLPSLKLYLLLLCSTREEPEVKESV